MSRINDSFQLVWDVSIVVCLTCGRSDLDLTKNEDERCMTHLRWDCNVLPAHIDINAYMLVSIDKITEISKYPDILESLLPGNYPYKPLFLFSIYFLLFHFEGISSLTSLILSCVVLLLLCWARISRANYEELLLGMIS